MPAPGWEDLSVFLDADDFAVEAEIQLAGGETKTVTGIFDDPYLNAELGEYELDTSRPRFTCRMEDVLGVTRGDTITIGAEVLDILSAPQSDGTGMAILDLAPAG